MLFQPPPLCGESTIAYIHLRRCEKGGYCFYRLEEPNCADTYYALFSLNLTNNLAPDPQTEVFLLDRQKPDGSYESLSQAFFCIGGLRLLGKTPAYDPRDYVLTHLRLYEPHQLPPGESSIFTHLYWLAYLYRWLNINLPWETKKRLMAFLRQYQKKNGGFGHPFANLLETRDASVMLSYLTPDIDKEKLASFLRSCEDNTWGFVNVPGGFFSYLEHIQAGLELCTLLSVSPSYPKAIIDTISSCRRANGGYSRTTHAGIATLEYTYLALSSLAFIKELKERPPSTQPTHRTD
jgi:hypothetical protein